MNAATAKRVTAAWSAPFPGLGLYRPLWLLRVSGPLVMGLCLDRSSDPGIYIPTFHVHCLLGKWPAISLSLNVRIKSSNGADSYVSTKVDETALAKAVAKMKELALLPLEGDCRLSDFEAAAAHWLREQRSPFWPKVLEDVILVRAWSGVGHEQALADAEKTLRTWPPTVTDRLGGVDAWVSRVGAVAQDRARLDAIMTEEIAAHGLAGMPKGAWRS